MRLEIRKLDDGRGPYRWQPVIRTPEGLAAGTIYDKPEPISAEESACVRSLLGGRYEFRESAE